MSRRTLESTPRLGHLLAFSLVACAPLYHGQTAYGVSVATPRGQAIAGQCIILRTAIRNHSFRTRYVSLLDFTVRLEMIEGYSKKHIRVSFEDRIPDGDPPHHPAPRIYEIRPLDAMTLTVELPLPVNTDPVQLTWFAPPGGHIIENLVPPFYLRIGVGVLPNRPDIGQQWWSDRALPMQRSADSAEIQIDLNSSVSDPSKCTGDLLQIAD